MNKKGFTLVEILAVIVILSVLAGIATLSVTRYQALVREKEKVHLHAEIESNYSNLILNGKANDSGVVNFCPRDSISRQRHIIMTISYDGKRLGCTHDSNADIVLKYSPKNDHTKGSYLITKNKGDLLGNENYIADAPKDKEGKDLYTLEERYVRDGICTVEVDEDRQKLNQDGTETKSKLAQTCVKNNDGVIEKASNSIICVKLVKSDGSILMNDFDASDSKNTSFCKYFGE